ncbi:MAG: von Willebrand factor type A domain-containing protein, partial [Rhizobiales bacterium]|nr:von Willebrand factor type A domain-containing protein [Hyphomicrobiales bacterium]
MRCESASNPWWDATRMDELERLKAELRAEVTLPPPGTRAAAIALAIARFEKISQESRQGTESPKRLNDRAGAFIGRLRGRPIMQSIRLSHALMMGTSLAVLTLVAININTLIPLMREPMAIKSDAGEKEVDATTAPRQDTLAAKPVPLGESVPSEPAARSADALATRIDVAESPPAPAAGLVSGVANMRREKSAAAPDQQPQYYRDQGRDRFTEVETNPVKVTAEEPVSTFSIDVDTASYAFIRASLNDNTLPQKDAVRVEEMINYFPYDYAGPADRAEPFTANVSVFPAPWNPANRLLHI